MRNLRAAALAAIMLFAPALSEAQTVTPLNTLVSGSTPPTGFTLQPFDFNCTTGTAECWPLMQIYDGTTRATVNPNGGINVNLLGGTVGVTGTFFQATQPVSAASLPLPSGAATAANQEVTAAGTSATSAQAVQGVTGGVAMPTNITQIGGTSVVPDPCQANTPSVARINLTSGTTQIITGTSGKNTFLCSISFPPQAAAITATVIEGTGTNCTTITGTTGVLGFGTTAAAGFSIAANGGFVEGNGSSWVAEANGATGDNVCIATTGAIGGTIKFVQQ